jgi:hypothetical protein
MRSMRRMRSRDLASAPDGRSRAHGTRAKGLRKAAMCRVADGGDGSDDRGAA